MEQWNALGTGAKESDANLSEVISLLLVVATGRQLGARIRRIDESEEIRSVVQNCVEIELEPIQGTSDNLVLDLAKDFDGHLIHLIPEVLAGKKADVHVGKVSERGGECPFGKSALARGFASPAHTAKFKGLADAETFVALRHALRVRPVAQSAAVSSASHSEMTVNSADKVEFACDGEDGSHSAVGTRLDAQCFGRTESSEKVVGFSQVGEDEEMGLAVDTAGFDDPPVGMTADTVLLKAGHVFVYTIERLTECSQKNGTFMS
jgi:hypothetical protein